MSMNNVWIKNSIAIAILFGMFIVAMIMFDTSLPVQASINQGSEYLATSTGQYSANGEITSGIVSLKTNYGSLGSVVITGDNTGMLHFYDATTSDVSKRTGNKPTTTIHIATIAASAAENTYVFDAVVAQGLLMVVSGTAPTSTVTYR